MSFKIWVDADACPKPVKEIVFKTSFRLNIEVNLVANSYMSIPHGGLIRLIQVDQGADVADSYIVENLVPQDLVITADIILASLVVGKGALAINPRGELYTEENMSERLSMRDFMHGLRESGIDTGGPAAFNTKDKEAFANTLNKMVTKLMQTRS